MFTIVYWCNQWCNYVFLAGTRQLYKWCSLSVFSSVCPPIRLSVTPFWLCPPLHGIMKFSGVITSNRSDVHAKVKVQMSKVKVTEVNIQLSHFWTVTPLWIHIRWWNDAQRLMLLRRGALLFFKIIRQISRSHRTKKGLFWPELSVSRL